MPTKKKKKRSLTPKLQAAAESHVKPNLPGSSKSAGHPTPQDPTKGNTITLRVPSYYSKALHSLASKPPPVVQMSKLTAKEIALAGKKGTTPIKQGAQLAEKDRSVKQARTAEKARIVERESGIENERPSEKVPEEIDEEIVDKKPILKKKSKLKALKRQRVVASQRDIPTATSEHVAENQQLVPSSTSGSYSLEGIERSDKNAFNDLNGHGMIDYAPLESSYFDAVPDQSPPSSQAESRIRSGRDESGSGGREAMRCLKCEKSTTTALQMKLSTMKLEKEVEKLRVEVEFYKSKDRENQAVMNSLRETQEYFLNRIRVLEMEIRNQPPATPLLHIPNGVPEIAPASMPQRKRKTATVAATAAVAATPEVDDADKGTPIATSRPKRHSAPLKGTTNGDTVQEEDTPTRPSKRAKIKSSPKPMSHLRPIAPKPPFPSTVWAEPADNAEDAAKTADEDFDPYESGDEPEASDDSDFDPSVGGKGKQKKAKTRKKPIKGVGGKGRKKDLDREEVWTAGGATATGNDSGWDFEIQMNPDFLEGDADGDDLQLLEGQFDAKTINPKRSVAVSDAAAPRQASANPKASSVKKKRESISAKSAPAANHQTMVTISDSQQSSKVIPVKGVPTTYRANGPLSTNNIGSASASPSAASMTPDWNAHLNQLMTESFDIQTRKHVKFEELDTSTLQRIQGTVHEKFGVGFKDIFVAMRKKSIADNKKINCSCPDCVFLAVEEASETW